MRQDDEYRKNAALAQEQADKAKTENDRESWLRVAQGWLSLIRNGRKTETEMFEEAATKRGTKQETSEMSH